MSAHVPVMLEEVVEALRPRDRAIYVDGTFGGGGYSEALLSRADCTVYGIDRDAAAIARGQGLAERYAGRLTLIHGRFSEMDELLATHGVTQADGVALDLGVSSFQLDEAERGFSFGSDGPLDMRMNDREGATAADLVNTLPESELADILFRYGEEKRARAVARAIVAARPIARTLELANIVERVVGRGAQRIHPATRTFQALRIAVNDELGELERGLDAAERVLKPEGRLAVVSFHSLEDRIVKQFLAERSGRVSQGSRHAPARAQAEEATFRQPGKNPVPPTDAEIRVNPRARSARLRTAVRTIAPARTSSPSVKSGEHA
jgi:16S rRNA (cytosine1402-N4)-methyltransferase